MRRVVVLLIAGVAVLLAAAPAFAHEEINPSTFPTGKPVFFTLTTANEAKADLVKLTLSAPAGVPFGATTKEPTGWAVNRTDEVITWSGGTVKPDHFEQWGFEIEGADQPGTITYKLTLGYADGKSDAVTVDVSASADTASATTTKTSGPTSRANAALAIAIVAMLVAVAAVVMNRRTPAVSPTAPPPDAKAAQDW